MAGKETESGKKIPKNNAEYEFPYEWIKGKCSNSVPCFPLNQHLLSQLNKLKNLNEKVDNDTEILRKMFKLAITSATENGKVHDPLIKVIHLDFVKMKSSRNVLQAVSRFHHDSGLLQTQDFSTVQVQLSKVRCELSEREARVKMLTSTAQQQLQQLMNHCSLQNSLAQRMEQQIAEVEIGGDTMSQSQKLKQQEICKLQADKDVLKHQLESLSQEMPDLDSAGQLYQEVLTELQNLKKENEETARLQAQQKPFCNIPPDVTLAKAQMQRKQNELKDLKGEIAFLVSSMNVDSYM